jgi:hypothetical protein
MAYGMAAKKKPAKKRGLYANIKAKRDRIKAGSGEKMRKPGAKGAPTAKAFKKAEKTAKKSSRKAAGNKK